MTRVACWLASLGPCGYFPIAPATFASFVLAALYLLVPEGRSMIWDVATLVGVVGLGIWAADRAETVWGHDPRRVVIDEAAGMAVTLAFMPAGLESAVAGFIAFRLFDIAKPFPARRAESLPGGVGVVMDDLIAGVYAQIAARLALALL